MNNVLSLLFSVFISVIVAILSYYCTDDLSIFNSILFGLLSLFILHVIITSVNSDRFSKDLTEIKAKLTTENKNNFDYYWMSCVEKAIAGTYTLVSKNCIKISQSEFRRFWLMAIANTDKKWECTLYSNDPQDINYWFKEGFKLQGLFISLFGLHVKRLFIFDKKEDITKNVFEHMEWQQSIGIEVKILILENKMKWSGYEHLLKILETIDIAIINDTYLMSFFLEENTVNNKKYRSLNDTNFCSELEKVKKVQQIYSEMWSSSLTIPQIEPNGNSNRVE